MTMFSMDDQFVRKQLSQFGTTDVFQWCLYNKQNNTWLLGDMKFLSCTQWPFLY